MDAMEIGLPTLIFEYPILYPHDLSLGVTTAEEFELPSQLRVHPADDAELCEKVKALIENNDLYSEMSAACLSVRLSLSQPDRMVRKVEEGFLLLCSE
jgi:hypothetical protein